MSTTRSSLLSDITRVTRRSAAAAAASPSARRAANVFAEARRVAAAASAARRSAAATITTRRAHQSKQIIDLVGRISHQITGAKLPSNRQVLQVFFYNMRIVNLNARESANLTFKAVLVFWEQARIPMRYESRCVDRIIALYGTWQKLQKNRRSRTASQTRSEGAFEDSLDDLFDISSADALEKMRIEEDKKFLIMQRKKGRPGCMAGVDMVLSARERRSAERQQQQCARKRKHDEMSQVSGECIFPMLSK